MAPVLDLGDSFLSFFYRAFSIYLKRIADNAIFTMINL